MKPLKAPGVDGLHALFFQSQWEIVGNSLFQMVSSLFNGTALDQSFNRTLIALVPKVECPSTVKEFRPISLCSVLYKLVTKVISNRLKPLMPLLISPYQSSFIQGRSITDNIIIAQEVIHSMRRKQGKKGWMVIKVDLEKAFDKLNWSFIEDTLKDVGLPSRIVSLIMQCVTTSSMQILWNGRPTTSFTPSRGIRQGDPLSPYLFVLCMERLSQAISVKVQQKQWETISLGRGGPSLSHLFFADDLILFGSTTPGQLLLIQDILQEFCHSSGQVVSQSKTRIQFSKNVARCEADMICQFLQFQKTEQLGKYLGVPLLHSRVTKDTYHYLIEKVQLKLSNWKAKSLSLAGRITLAKSVLTAIPYYTMQTSLLPVQCCKNIEKIVRGFIWGSDGLNRKTSLVSWKEISQPLQHGGCGIKNLKGQNEAFLSKLAFSLISQPDKLWVQVLKGKYKWGRDTKYKFKTKIASHTWRSIATIWNETELNISWDVGDGTTTRFWRDHWLGDRGPLKFLSFADIPESELEKSVCDYVDEQGQWKWENFEHQLPENLNLQIARTLPPQSQNPSDTCFWNLTSNGAFTVSSAYHTSQQFNWDEQKPFWTWIWKWPGLPRTRTFLWLAVKNRLLTNAERLRRGISHDIICSICQEEIEDLNHVLRRCPTAHNCWLKVIPQNCASEFFSQPFKEWLLWNLHPRRKSTRWRLFFGTLCWKLWNHRNACLFANESMTTDCIISYVCSLVSHIVSTGNLLRFIDSNI